MFTKEQEVISSGVQYSTIAFAFSTLIMISLSFEKIFQAVGRMKLTMISLMIGCISNIILDPLLIFGVGIFPEMGIRGAALATGPVSYTHLYRTPTLLSGRFCRHCCTLQESLFLYIWKQRN